MGHSALLLQIGEMVQDSVIRFDVGANVCGSYEYVGLGNRR